MENLGLNWVEELEFIGIEGLKVLVIKGADMQGFQLEQPGVGVVLIGHLDLRQVKLLPKLEVIPSVGDDGDIVVVAGGYSVGALFNLVGNEECQSVFILAF